MCDAVGSSGIGGLVVAVARPPHPSPLPSEQRTIILRSTPRSHACEDVAQAHRRAARRGKAFIKSSRGRRSVSYLCGHRDVGAAANSRSGRACRGGCRRNAFIPARQRDITSLATVSKRRYGCDKRSLPAPRRGKDTRPTDRSSAGCGKRMATGPPGSYAQRHYLLTDVVARGPDPLDAREGSGSGVKVFTVAGSAQGAPRMSRAIDLLRFDENDQGHRPLRRPTLPRGSARI